MVSVFVLAVLVTVAVLFPRPVAELANPYRVPDELVSTWVVVDVSIALIRYLGSWGFGLFTLLGASLALLPLLDRGPERRLRRRPVIAVLSLTFVVGFVAAWVAGRSLRSVPPTIRPSQELIEDRVAPAVPTSPDLPAGNPAGRRDDVSPGDQSP